MFKIFGLCFNRGVVTHHNINPLLMFGVEVSPIATLTKVFWGINM